MISSMALVGTPSVGATKVQRPSATRGLMPLVKAARPARSMAIQAAAVPEMVPDMDKRVRDGVKRGQGTGREGSVWIRMRRSLDNSWDCKLQHFVVYRRRNAVQTRILS